MRPSRSRSRFLTVSAVLVTCFATYLGVAPSADAVSKPSAPTLFQATSAADGQSATVTWAAPTSDGGSPITNYTVTRDGAPVVLGLVFTYTWSGLTPGTAYTFGVAATNINGTGPEASVVLVTAPAPPPPIPPAAPGAPEIGRAFSGHPGGPATARVTWFRPDVGGYSPITNYRVIAYKVNRGHRVVRTIVSKLLPADARSLRESLHKGRYRFAVVALNAVGPSVPSAMSKLVRAR